MKRERKAIMSLMRSLERILSCYGDSVKQYDMKQSELLLMYALAEGVPLSQKQLCEEWAVPKTTLNAVIKKWQCAGYVELVPVPGKRREMTILLTEAGQQRTEACLNQLFRMEENAMQATLSRYSSEFIEAVRFFEQELEKNHEQIFCGRHKTVDPE